MEMELGLELEFGLELELGIGTKQNFTKPNQAKELTSLQRRGVY